MKNSILFLFWSIVLVFAFSCSTKSKHLHAEIPIYEPADKELYEKISALDKEYFDAYNTCDLEKQANMYSDEIEFFHDKGGLMTSKEDLIKALEDNICGKVTRELVKGSIEVYPIPGYGAVQIGYHRFFNKLEPNAESNPSKFIAVWKESEGDWKMAKVFSFH